MALCSRCPTWKLRPPTTAPLRLSRPPSAAAGHFPNGMSRSTTRNLRPRSRRAAALAFVGPCARDRSFILGASLHASGRVDPPRRRNLLVSSRHSRCSYKQRQREKGEPAPSGENGKFLGAQRRYFVGTACSSSMSTGVFRPREANLSSPHSPRAYLKLI